MITAMHGSGHCIAPTRDGHAKRNRQHDGVTVRHHRDAHGFLRIVAIGHSDIIGEGRAGEIRANVTHVDQMMWHIEACGAGGGEDEFLAMIE